MNFEDASDEIGAFGLNFKDIASFHVLKFYVDKHGANFEDVLDKIVAHAANCKVFDLDEKFLSTFLESVFASVKIQEDIPLMPIVPPPSTNTDVPMEDLEVSDQLFTVEQVETVTGVFKRVATECKPSNKISLVDLREPDEYDDNQTIDKDLIGGTDDTFITGRVHLVKTSDCQYATLLSQKFGNLRLDLNSILYDYVFDKMSVMLEGNLQGKVFFAKNLIKPDPTPSAELEIQNETHLCENGTIMTARGPFNSESSIYPFKLTRVFNQAKASNAKLLVLFGPVLELSKNLLVGNAYSMQALFDNFIRQVIATNTNNIEVIVVPAASSDPFALLPQYPTPPYYCSQHDEKTLTTKHVHLVPNPCVVNFCGMQVAISNYDTILALNRAKLANVAPFPTINRMHWSLGIMLQYGLICPSFEAINVFVKRSFSKLPTIFLTPSLLKRFSAFIENVVCVNIGLRNSSLVVISPKKVTPINSNEVNINFETKFLK